MLFLVRRFLLRIGKFEYFIINVFTNSLGSSESPDNITNCNHCVYVDQRTKRGNLPEARDSKYVHKLFTLDCKIRQE